MATKSLDRLLTEFEECRYRRGQNEAPHVVQLLASLAATRFTDAASLIRFHETVLFLRAFPHHATVLRKTEMLLNGFGKRVEALRKTGADLEAFDPLEVSGMAGTSMEDTLSFDVARWLAQRLPKNCEIHWQNYDEDRALAATLPRFLPLLEDDGYVEADTPWQRWLQTAQGDKSPSPAWLIRRFEDLPVRPRDQAELYESLRVPLRWHLGNSRLSRTRNWLRAQKPFYHDQPLISRSQVLLGEELAKGPPVLTRLSEGEGSAIVNMVREVMLVRYRELYGTTLADPASVVRAEVGRGVAIYLWNLPPDRRLPLRAYVAGFTLKNGVPINYVEAIGLFEWMEVGFNTFYTFRGGEVGWIYAQALRCLFRLMGTKCISVYPYQLGKDNDEAIDSGAFWFYRKLGFRPGRPELVRLAKQEERKLAAKPGYRTPARILRRLAEGHVFYELSGSEIGAWDTFSTRNLGWRVNRRMAAEFGGDSDRIRQASSQAVASIVGVQTSSWKELERATFENLALVLALIPDLAAWTDEEKRLLLQIIRAKPKPDEMLYMGLLQKHSKLRAAFLKLGSTG